MARKQDRTEEVEAFVLRDCGFGKSGDVVIVSSSDADAGVAVGALDLSEGAVSAAKAKK